jgi:hypothetical protein
MGIPSGERHGYDPSEIVAEDVHPLQMGSVQKSTNPLRLRGESIVGGFLG